MKPLNSIYVLFILFILVGCRETIVHDVNETDANRILSGLDSAGFDVEKERQPTGTWNLLVKKSQSLQAIKFMDARRLHVTAPRSTAAKSGIMRDRDDSRFRYERALSAELEYTLASIDGVLDVRVHLNLPERDPLLGRKLSTAPSGSGSVLLIVQDASRINSEQIKNLISGAGGIGIEQINVLVSQAASSDDLPMIMASAGASNLVVDTKSIEIVDSAAVNSDSIEHPTSLPTGFYSMLTSYTASAVWIVTILFSAVFLMLTIHIIKRHRLNKVVQLFDTQQV